MYDDDRASTHVLDPVPDEAPTAFHPWRADPPRQRSGYGDIAEGWLEAVHSVRRTLVGHKVAFAAAGIVLGTAAVFGGHLARLAASVDHTPPAAAATAPPTTSRPVKHAATPKTHKPRAHRPAPAPAPRPHRTHKASPTPKATKTTASPSPSPSKTTASPSPTPSGSSEPPPTPPPPTQQPPGGTT